MPESSEIAAPWGSARAAPSGECEALAPTRRGITQIVAAIAINYALMLGIHLAHPDKPAAAFGLASSLFFLVLTLGLGLTLLRWHPGPHARNRLMGMAAIAIALNVALNYAAEADPGTAGMFIFYVMAVGGLLLDRRWALAGIGAGLLGWLLATLLAVPHARASRDGMVLVAASFVGLLLHEMRTRAIRRSEAHRAEADARREQAEESLAALHRAQRSLLGLIEKNPDGMLVLSGEQIVLANDALAGLLRWSRRDALLGRSLGELSVVSSRAERESLDSLNAFGAPAEMVFRRRDGEPILLEVVARSIDWHGEPSTLLIARDATIKNDDRHAQILMADRLLSVGRLAAGVAHEINNPLSYVLGNLDELGEQLASPPAQREPETLRRHLEEAREGTRRIRDIVHDLKSFSRANEEETGSVDLLEVLESSLRMVRNDLRHHATIVRHIRSRPRVIANEARLGQVFVNLLINAAHAMEEGSPSTHRLDLVLDEREGEAILEFRDTGVGMSRETLRRIFEPFYTNKPIGKGTGLGLHFCRTTLTRLGGAIDVESGPGRGSLFRIRIPAEQTAALPLSGSSERSKSESPPRLAPMRLLILDDDPRVARSLARLLRHHRVEQLTSAPEGIDRFVSGGFDALICDVMMPEMSGVEVHQRIAERLPGAEDRILFVTGGVFAGPLRSFLETLPHRVLEKPVERAELDAALRRLPPCAPAGSRPPSRHPTPGHLLAARRAGGVGRQA